MIFEGKLVKDGKTSKIASKAFDEAKNISSATHLKLKDSNEFVEITDKLIIKRKKNSDGNPTNDVVHYTDINKNEEFACVIDGKDVAISPNFYVQIVLMNKDADGSYYKSDDGVYINKQEIQVPAYKKFPLQGNMTIEAPVHNGEFYVQTEVVVLPNGAEIILPNDKVKEKDGKWLYQRDNGQWIECYYKKDLDTRKFIKHILLDNEKIVDIRKLEEKPNGEYVLKDIDGEDVVVGKKDVTLQRAFVEGSTITSNQMVVIPSNILKQRPRMEDNVSLAFKLRMLDENGILEKITVSQNRTIVTFIYEGGHKIVYALPNIVIRNLKPGDKEIRVDKFNIIDLGNDGVKIEFLQMKKDIAQNVHFRKGKVSSYTLNERNITDIKWHEVEGLDQISSYIIDGVKISDIELVNGEIKSCKIHLIDEDGNEVIEKVIDLMDSKYKNFAITYKLTREIEDVKTEGSKVSFKMGDYYFTDAELTEDGNIGKCKLRHNGKEEEINLSTDERFAQLKLAVKVSLDEQRITPLIQSQLLQKKDGQYHLEADVIQTEEMKDYKNAKGGVAKAKNIESVSQAIQEQERFKNNPFKTVIIDDKDKSKTHTISDFNTTYKGAADFELKDDILIDVIGKNKVEVKKGEVQIDSKKDDTRRDNLIVLGFALCSNPITLVFGVPLIFAGTVAGVIAPMVRRVKKSLIENRDPDKYKQNIQDNTAKYCKENINKLVADYRRELQAYKKLYSQKEFEEKAAELREKFRFEYNQEVCKLQLLGGGSIKCEFDASQKTKLNKSNYLAYLEYVRKSEELRYGKKDHPDMSKILKEFNNTKFLDDKARMLEQVRIYQQYGGVFYQNQAHAIKMQNIQLFLNQENLARAKRKEKGISLEDYKKQLEREYNESKSQWGGIKDKLDAFKQTPEYLRADRQTRKKLLTDKKSALESEILKLKIDNVQFTERLDKHGNPIIQKYTQSLMYYREYIDQMFTAGETKLLKSFTFDFYDKLSNKEQKGYMPSQTLSEASVRKINTADNRRLSFDREKSKHVSHKIETVQQRLDSKVKGLKQEVLSSVQNATYEDLIKLEIQQNQRLTNLENAYKKSEQLVEMIPNKEINEGGVKQIKQTATTGEVALATIRLKIQQAKEEKEAEYRKQVRVWARNEYIEQHEKEFVAYIEGIKKHIKNYSPTAKNHYRDMFIEFMKNTTDSQTVSDEIDTLEVKHHIEDNIDAEVYCEENKIDYKKFVDEYNAKYSTKQLDPNSEIARCRYYAYCKKTDSAKVDRFKSLLTTKRKDKTKERLENNTLPKHEKKSIKIKRQGKESSKTQAQAKTASVAPTVERIA